MTLLFRNRPDATVSYVNSYRDMWDDEVKKLKNA